MNIDWQEVKNKFPIAFRKFLESYTCCDVEAYYDCNKNFHVKKYNENSGQFELDVCYCDLEDFFDNNGIRINIFNNYSGENWEVVILKKEYGSITNNLYWSCKYQNNKGLNSRQKAKEAAIPKAFETLDEILEDLC